MNFNTLKYKEITRNINKYNKKTIKLIAVSKNHPAESVNLAINCGIKIFGENRVQEAEKKFSQIRKSNPDIELHLTGPLQTNKVKTAIKIFDIFQTLDREKLANEFNKYKHMIGNKKFFIQVNIGEEKNKSGISPNNTNEFIDYCKNDLELNIIGLMCIPPVDKKPDRFFLELKKIANEKKLNHLSMGMSGDYLDGIRCGATYIRVGTLLFGNRDYAN